MNFDFKFDFQRRDRLGLIEAIWGQDKSIDQLERLSENVLSKNEIVFIGQDLNEKLIRSLLDNCLSTNQEIVTGKWESGYEDSWPVERVYALN